MQFLFASCRQNKTEEIKIIWKNNQAVGISVPERFFEKVPPDSVSNLFQVRLEDQNKISILGEYKLEEELLLFKPLIPFSTGLSYEIVFQNKLIGKIKIPSVSGDAPALVAIYPTQDTLPENLLKLYFRFSHPMREGESQKYIWLLNDHHDTIPDVFLILQPELWNEERTVLTIWLDPGRIKRDLLPNQQMGNPLKKDEWYTLVIASEWKDQAGLALSQSYSRRFAVGSRDSLSPDIDRWLLDIPAAGTTEPFIINTGEPLDYFLLQETIRIIDENGNTIPGSLTISNEETTITFHPSKRWPTGRYRLLVGSHLEDLAGNNLNRAFDQDITLKKIKPDLLNYEKPFLINSEDTLR